MISATPCGSPRSAQIINHASGFIVMLENQKKACIDTGV